MIGRDGLPRPTELQLPDDYLLDEEHFTPEALVVAGRKDSGGPDPLRVIGPV